jgi:hypothetical protein
VNGDENRSILVTSTNITSTNPAEIYFSKGQNASVGLGDYNRDFFIQVNGIDRINIDHDGNSTINGALTVNRQSLFRSNASFLGTTSVKEMTISNGSALEFGAGITDKQKDAGKICYGCFSEKNSLNIVGGGTTDANRKIYFYAEGGARFNGKLYVKSGIFSTDYSVTDVNNWSDFVFSDGYKLRSLKETEAFILKNKHLPTIPSESEVKENGYNMHEMNTKLLQTIEELTLHAIEQEKKIASQNNEMEKMQKELAEIKMLLSSKK